MLKFLLEIIIICSFGIILYLFARALPRMKEAEEESSHKKTRSDALSVYLEKMDEWITMTLEKFLRRAKVWVMKLDNSVSNQLNKFKKDPVKETGFEDKIEIEKEEEGEMAEEDDGMGEEEEEED